MKKTPLTRAVDEVIALKLRAADEYIEEVVELLEEVGNPETLLGKKYEEWTRDDLVRLGQIYGKEPNPLSKLIFKKEYEKVLKAEKEVGG